MFFLSILFSLIVSAEMGITQSEALAATGLTEQQLLMETQKSLESYLFNDGDGISCGLDEFDVSGYTAPSAASGMTQFTVITRVVGPVGYCAGYESYSCYTTWKNKNNTWAVAFTECDEGLLFEE